MAIWTLVRLDSGGFEIVFNESRRTGSISCGVCSSNVPVDLGVKWMFEQAAAFDAVDLDGTIFIKLTRAEE